jgi:hypothetical protein
MITVFHHAVIVTLCNFLCAKICEATRNRIKCFANVIVLFC